MQVEKWEAHAPLPAGDVSFNRFILLNLCAEVFLFIFSIFLTPLIRSTNFSIAFCSVTVFLQLIFIIIRIIKMRKDKIHSGKTNRLFILILYAIMLFPALLLMSIFIGIASFSFDMDYGIGIG